MQQLILVVMCLLLTTLPAAAQDDPCDACIADWSVGECPCLPAAPEPPTSSLACVPQTHAIDGCTDKVFLPQLGR